MAGNELEITLKLVDDATPKARKNIKQLGEEGGKSAEKTESGFRKAGKVIQDFRKEIFALSVAFGALAVGLNELGKRNFAVKQSLDEIGLALRDVTSKTTDFILKNTLLGVAFKVLSLEAKAYNDVQGGTYTEVQRAKSAIEEMNQVMADQKVLFLDARMSAEDYFDGLMLAQQDVLTINQMGAVQMQELSRITGEIRNTELLNAELQTQEQIGLLNEYKNNYMVAHQGMAAFTVTMSKSIKTNVGQAFSSMITGAKSAKEAFADMGKAMVSAIVSFMVQKVIAWALEKTLLAGTVAASVTSGRAIAAAWRDAALYVTLATAGANAIPAAAGVASVGAALTVAGAIGLGASGSSGAARSIGVSVNGGESAFATSNTPIPRARGGDDIVTRPTLFLAGEAGPERATFTPLGAGDIGGGGSGIEVNIFGGNFNSREMVAELAEMIGVEIERKLANARQFV